MCDCLVALLNLGDDCYGCLDEMDDEQRDYALEMMPEAMGRIVSEHLGEWL